MDRKRLLTLFLPAGVSLLVHLALLAVIAAVSITAVRLANFDDPSSDVAVALEHPASTPESRPASPALSPVAALEPPASVAPPNPTDLVPPPVVLSPPIAAAPPIATAPSIDMRRAIAPGAAFAGLRADRARRVVYVVDISGPMTSSLSFVLDELRRSVSRLDPSQVFQVVLFRDSVDEPGNVADPGVLILAPAATPPRLLPATASNRAALAAFLDTIRPGGRSNPLAGLRAALAFHPDAIFLLARGISRTGPNARWGEGRDTILAQLDRLNPADAQGHRRTSIQTIQFIDDDPTGLMQAIAQTHGQSAASYTRRNVEDLATPRDASPIDAMLDAPDPEVDRAATLLWDLSATRLDLRAIFGLANDDERVKVRQASARALEPVASADQPGSARADELARLVLARALLLRAATEPGSRGPILDRAIAALDTSDGAPAEVLATAASAHALRMSPGDPDAADALARRAIDADPSTLPALEARLAAILALADNPARVRPYLSELTAAMSRPPFIASGRLDAPLALTALDASAAGRLRQATTAAAIDAALAEHLAWARTPRAGLPAEAVLSAAGRLIPPNAALDSIAPELALARGLALIPAPGAAPSADCLRALDIAGSRAGPGSAIAETAGIRAGMAMSLWASRQPEGETEGRAGAVERLDRVLRAFPGRAWQRDAALHVVAHTGAMLGSGVADEAVAGPRRRALRVLVLEDPRPEARSDGWRLELARRTAEAEGTGGDEPLGTAEDREDAALALLNGPWQDRPEMAADRLAAWVLSRRVARLTEELSAAQRAGEGGRAGGLAAGIAEAARRAITLAEHSMPESPEASDALRADLAEALIVLKSPEASEIYAGLRDRGVTLGRSEAFMALAQARALLAQGDSAGAFGLLRGVTSELAVPSGDDPDTFWHAWTLTLQLLTERGVKADDAEARQTAAAHLLRLHDLDEGLGGEPWRSRLEAIAVSIGLGLESAGAIHSPP